MEPAAGRPDQHAAELLERCHNANGWRLQGGHRDSAQPGSLSLSSSRTAPSIHIRAALTWLAIFPLVAIGLTAMAPFTVGWAPLLRAFVLTLVVVPLAVYLVVPRLMSIYDRYLAPRRKG